jgi:hypothetical protein
MQKIYFLLSLLFLISCNSPKQEISGADPNALVMFKHKKPSTLGLSNIVDKIEYELLLVPDTIKFALANQSIWIGDKLYLRDIPNNKIIVINSSSKEILYQINNSGQGPEEYITLGDFDIDKDGNVYTYDFGRKIQKYTNGKFSKNYNIKPLARAMAKIDSGFVLFCPDTEMDISNSLVMYHENGNLIKGVGSEKLLSSPLIPISMKQRISWNKLIFNNIPSKELVYLDDNGQDVVKSKILFEDGSQEFDLIQFLAFENYLILALNVKREFGDSMKIGLFQDNIQIDEISGMLNDIDGFPFAFFDGFNAEKRELYKVWNQEALLKVKEYFIKGDYTGYLTENSQYLVFNSDKRFKVSRDLFRELENFVKSLPDSNENFLVLQRFKLK